MIVSGGGQLQSEKGVLGLVPWVQDGWGWFGVLCPAWSCAEVKHYRQQDAVGLSGGG